MPDMTALFRRLKYLYVGTSDFGRDLAFYKDVLGGRVLWHFRAFGTEVCAFDLGTLPYVLLAEHRAPGILPIFSVDDLEAAATALRARGWRPKDGPFGTPDGDAYLFTDPSGNEYAFFEDTRPDALVAAYAEPHAENAVRHD